MAQDGVFVYPGAGESRSSSADFLTAAALMGNGGFGGMNNPLWMMFMWPMLYPMMSMYGGFGGWGNAFGGWNGAGNGYIANQLNNDAGREVILQAIQGSTSALSQLAQLTHTDVASVRDAIGIVNTKLAEVGGQIGMSGLQVISELKSGNAAIAQQLCQCCCENRLATTQLGYENRLQTVEQTNLLGSQADRNHAATQLQLAQNEAADQLSVCQQTNTLSSQANANTQSIKDLIYAQNAMLEAKFCEIKERELQSKIDTQSDIITQLRGQLDNDRQTSQLFNAINPLQAKVNEIANKQPNTVPVQYPNLVAVNATPYGYVGQTNFWN